MAKTFGVLKVRVLVVVNAHSRKGHEPAEPALAVLRAAGCDVRLELATRPQALPAIIAHHGSESDLIVVGGGDGTLNAVAAALIEAGKPVGILPLGTANDLARTLAIPTDLAEAAKVIVGGHSRPIDVGDVNGVPFFNVAIIGLAVALKRELSGEAKRRWGKIGYGIAGVWSLTRLHRFRAQIRHGEEAIKVRTVQIAVGNGRYYGGFATVDEDAALDDGKLHLYSIETEGRLRLLMMLPDFLLGRQRVWSDVRRLVGTAFEIRTERPRQVLADGEEIATTPAFFGIRPRALRILVPPRTAGS